MKPEEYLGDGVYAVFEHGSVWLDLRAQPFPSGHYCRICLDPPVLDALFKFAQVHLPTQQIKQEG